MRTRPVGGRRPAARCDGVDDARCLRSRSPRWSPSCAAPGRGELTVVEIVPGARTVLLDGLADPTATAEARRARWHARPRRRDRRQADGRDPGRRSTAPTSTDRRRRLGRRPRPRWSTGCAAHPAPGRVLRLRARASRYLPGCPTSCAVPRLATPAAPGAGRSVGAGRPVRRHLPDRVARRLAAGRPHRRHALRPRPRPAGAARPGHPGAVRGRVTAPGHDRGGPRRALTTVQDLGRPGYAHLGVPRSGALDRRR